MSLQGHKSDRAQTASPSTGRLSASNPRIQMLIESGPKRSTILLVLLGMVIGMVTAYVIIPTEFTGASPRHMSQQAVRQWVRMVAVGHSQDLRYDDSNALLFLQQIPNPQNVVESLAGSTAIPVAERAALEALTEINGYDNLVGPLAPQDPGIALSTLQIVLALAAVALIIPILTIAGRTIYPKREGRARTWVQYPPPAPKYPRQQRLRHSIIKPIVKRGPRRPGAKTKRKKAAPSIPSLARPFCARYQPT